MSAGVEFAALQFRRQLARQCEEQRKEGATLLYSLGMGATLSTCCLGQLSLARDGKCAREGCAATLSCECSLAVSAKTQPTLSLRGTSTHA